MPKDFSELPQIPTVIGSESFNIPRDFYQPLLENAVKFDRVTGYFSSVAFLLTWPGLRNFVQRGGKMRVLCSPHISERDADGIVLGYAAREDEGLTARLTAELDAMLESGLMRAPARLLAALISSGHLDIQLARVETEVSGSDLRLFHDKFGVFADESSNYVGFSGSLNETFSALAGVNRNGHVESVTVMTSWEGDRDAERLRIFVNRFESFWSGGHPSVRLSQLPMAFHEYVGTVAGDVSLEDALADVERQNSSCENGTRPDLHLFLHQRTALSAWRDAGRRGILEHATGSGKTRTGIGAIVEVADKFNAHSIVIVPSKLLLYQWEQEIRSLLGEDVLLCGDGHKEWLERDVLRSYLRSPTPKVVVAIGDTASSSDFIRKAAPFAQRILIVGDEAHRYGARRFKPLVLGLDAAYRLGLSATPRRFGDAEGTGQVLNYFGHVVDQFSLRDAIDAQRLVPYWYASHTVELTAEERDEYQQLTSQIRRLVAQLKSSDENSRSRRLDLLRLRRSRIVKQASKKLSVAVRVLAEFCEPSSRWLVYCDTVDDLHDLQARLRVSGLDSQLYFAAMHADQKATLDHFRLHGGILLSVRCLDEGVDIPAADHALICASSQNPREFIQRRGRILRRDGTKSVAYLHDLIVTPGVDEPRIEDWVFVLAEMGRALGFAKDAENREAEIRLINLWASLGLELDDLERIAEQGLESDSEDDF